MKRGTPQGGVLSPLLWLLVVNTVLKKLDENYFKVVAYADDVAIIISGIFPNVICSKMNTALRMISDWAKSCGLDVNPSKTDLILFTKNRIPSNLDLPGIDGKVLSLSSKAKYLGVILDPKLNWYPNIEDRVTRSLKAFYACRKSFGKSWGLSSKLIMWIYTAVIRPILMYGSIVWWCSLKTAKHIQHLSKVQRLISLAITGALRSTATESLTTILGLPPLFEFSKLLPSNTASNNALRLRMIGMWTGKSYGHCSILQKYDFISKTKFDYTIPKTCFNRKFDMDIPTREEWNENLIVTDFDLVIFTDGSKSEIGCGSAFYVETLTQGIAFKLPDDCSIFQCEIFAIYKACYFIKTLEMECKAFAYVQIVREF